MFLVYGVMVRSRGWLELEPLILTWDFGLLSREPTYPTKTGRKIIIFKSQLDMIGCRVRVMFFVWKLFVLNHFRGGGEDSRHYTAKSDME